MNPLVRAVRDSHVRILTRALPWFAQAGPKHRATATLVEERIAQLLQHRAA